MADQAMTQDLGDIEIEATRKGGLNGKKLVLFIILPVLLLVGGLAGAYFAGLLDPLLGQHEAPAEAKPAAAQTVFFALPQMLVNLNTGGRKNTYLKIDISLELTTKNDRLPLETLDPRVERGH